MNLLVQFQTPARPPVLESRYYLEIDKYIYVQAFFNDELIIEN